ncbi:MAG: HU family DNA-binding protein [Anaerolinea sp.]|nr:HU family DNA-binding protein [Anaerolinea sp.]
MTMNRKTTIREIGRRTRLKNRDVQLMLETLIEVWTEELVRGGRIEIENFAVFDGTKCHIRFRLARNLRSHKRC